LKKTAEYGFHANLSVFYLHADYRGQGIGSLMMQDAYELLQQIGCEALTTYNPQCRLSMSDMAFVYTMKLYA
jgi:GNAT superfamily N-acetyltransferase